MIISLSHLGLSPFRTMDLPSTSASPLPPPVLDHISNLDFLFRHALANRPCVLSARFTAHWPARHLWVHPHTGLPNLDYLRANFGEDSVPVLVDSDLCPRSMPFRAFIDQYISPVATESDASQQIAYLKDWHFQSVHPDQQHIYELPIFLHIDWINHEWWSRELEGDKNPFGGDYRFVYFGSRGSWTPFHCDVFNSFSWSANICGRKRWYLVKPGAEQRVGRSAGCDIRECLGQFRSGELFQFEQEPGQIVFVPSGWWHQVHNLEHAVSINHNVINAFNVHHLVALMERRLAETEQEIADVRTLFTDQEFDKQCQLILLADCKMNRAKMLELAELVIDSRQPASGGCPTILPPADGLPPFPSLDVDWLQRMQICLGQKCLCTGNAQLCPTCHEFVRIFELNRATEVKKRIRMT